ncbi:hypothetical protein G6F65_012202 [Rhizopus arrhizus]|nr:hypothetical protein G6F65_012202 [Rhizopus arrhizus]
MKGIKPGFQYAHLCQPIIKGGLGLLDPMIQHRCLQFRWLRQLFQDDDPVSCSRVYMKDFVQRFHSMGTTSLLSFFFPPLRAAANIHLGSFLPTMYEAMDSFLQKGSPDVCCNPSTLLSLPLLALFSDIPSGHWLLSHNRSKLQANQFFTYDQSLQRVRPLLRPDSPPYPRLSGRLVRDLQNRTVTLNNMTWNLILNDYPDLGSVDDFPFVSWLTRSVDWISFHPQEYRQTQSDTLLTHPLSTLSPLKWKQFWSLKILPEARIICFRFIYNKLHCNASVSRFDPTTTAACSLCHAALEDVNHLLITCSFKWSVWQGVLSRFAPYLEFRPEDIESILRNFSRFEFVDNSRLLRICSQAMLHIWRAHWRYIFDGTPFLPQQIVSTIFEKLHYYRLH